ncbi:MAG: flagellar M-ring protein FliF [Candidatus Scalindua sp. AMX11]|nr:MAG: flagellar M-ring protein FliF [Candidatus Scalindua sp.]NOG85772.1 flagellar M-ring protein FliF [Planctomycetota bacterium]RZV97052.1 MAG: flagellar M-ring protein FliF [Candidatus Scalindua sp. SCAELEC01]TDE66334.1 MAG: flagellar M-ring protein FliF [Candidatus Scalindua sp. AMX11]GJQ58274.1 MAG: flagellar M-ring protein [Candidatus Scalindua sp.]
MNQLLEQFSSIWQGTSFIQRLTFFALFLGFIVGFLGVVYWVRKPEFELLYANLGQMEAGDIIEELKEKDIPYKISDRGTSIFVPSNMVYELRMNLAKNGLPKGDVGFELFEQMKFGLSDMAQKVNYRRALQGELTKTISNLEWVEWARVQIVIPKPSLFIDEEKPSTASVIIKAKNNQRLRPSQITGITHLVSSSVEALNPENVTITDSMGNLLSRKEDSTVSGMITNQLDLKKKIEDYHMSKALSVVEKMTGEGKGIVKVSAELDFKHVDEKQIEYDQDRKVPISQTITTQLAEMPQMMNVDKDDQQLKNSKETEETETTQYALSKTERAVSDHVVKIKRLSVAVLVDGTYEEVKTEEGSIQRNFIKRSDEELAQISAIVKQSIGIDEKPPRNDTFEIQCVPFKGETPIIVDQSIIEKENKRVFILEIVKNSSLAIAVLAFLLFALKILKKLLSQKSTYATYSPNELPSGEQEFSLEEAGRKKLNEKRIQLRDGIIRSAKEDPRTTSNLVRKWMREDDA